MQWYEITILLPLSLLNSAYDFLWPYVNGLSVEKKDKGLSLKAYLFSDYPHRLMKKLDNVLHIKAKTFQARYSPPEANQGDLSLTNEFVIVPVPSSYVPPFGIPILIRRGRAFGTGSHPCTIYCLHGLQDILQSESESNGIENILDAGTGTGILAIAAAKLGAKDITGIDISPESLEEARENLRLNKVAGVQMQLCSVTEIGRQFDLILANLYGPLLIKIASSLIEHLSPKGFLILGGMAVPHDEVVIPAFTQYGLKVRIHYRDEEWAAVVLQRV